MEDTAEFATSWHSYPSIFALGHRALTDLFLDPVLVEEKIDGSQFSFGRFGPDRDLKCRSKGAQLNLVAPEPMFRKGIDAVGDLDLRPGWTYRGEYLSKAKHNTLAYDRVPERHVIIFDINPGHEEYLSHEEKRAEAQRIGLEVVPVVHTGVIADVEMFRSFLDRESVLGGQKVEGLVVKNYSRFGPDKKVLMGKFVSEAFKEAHAVSWKQTNPGPTDIIEDIVRAYARPARWEKAIQHLRDAGKLEGTPRDIGSLMAEVPTDIEKECAEEIAAELWKWAWPKIRRGVGRGLPEWYKERLLVEQFRHDDTAA